MIAAHLYTRRISGIDYRVWTVMLLTCLLCLAFYGYQQIQFNAANSQTCSSTGITINSEEGKAIELNRAYIFTIQTETNAKVEWEFGGVKGSDNKNVVQYKFTKEGMYKVLAKVNGRCKFEIEVIVRNPVLLPPEKAFFDIFIDSTTLKAGNTANFSCVTNQRVNSYKWTCTGLKEVQYGEVAAFTFANAGTYWVHLIVNNDSLHMISKEIKVEPTPLQEPVFDISNPGKFDPNVDKLLKPGENPFQNNNQSQKDPNPGTEEQKLPENQKEEPAKPKPTEIASETLKDLLQQVLNEEKEIEELFEYLYYKESTVVQDGDERMNIKEFCKKKKKKKIKSLELKKDEHGIQKIIVKMKGWSLFG
jgi:hypothetical protein